MVVAVVVVIVIDSSNQLMVMGEAMEVG